VFLALSLSHSLYGAKQDEREQFASVGERRETAWEKEGEEAKNKSKLVGLHQHDFFY
jgi:hypothetical protein